MNTSRWAGAFGGARLGKPRWVRILMITEGSSIAARMVKGPPHCGQIEWSIAKTRVSHWAQILRARGEGAESSPFPSVVFIAWSASPGTI